MAAVVTNHSDGTQNVSVHIRGADTVRTAVYIYIDHEMAFNLDVTVADPKIIETLIADLQDGLEKFKANIT